MAGYNRYDYFKSNGTMKLVPFIEIPKRSTDKYTYYREGITRMDLLSYQYYDSPDYGWLILQANPSLGSLEFNIPRGAKIRIPMPLSTALQGYENSLEEYEKLYGLNA